MKAWSKILIVFLFLAFLFSFQSVKAEADNEKSLVPCGNGIIDSNGETIECNFCHIFELADNIYTYVVFKLVPIVSVLMIAIGGFIILTGASNPEGYKKGMDIIKITVIALIIIYGSWLAIQFVLGILTSGSTDSTWYNPATWNQFNC